MKKVADFTTENHAAEIHEGWIRLHNGLIVREWVNNMEGKIDWSMIEGTQLYFDIVDVAKDFEDFYIKDVTEIVTKLNKIDNIKQSVPLKEYINSWRKWALERDKYIAEFQQRIVSSILIALKALSPQHYNRDVRVLLCSYLYFMKHATS